MPPHDLDAEESVLGSIMLSPDALTAVQAEGLHAGDFYRRTHGRIYLAAVDLAAHGTPVDAITVADYLTSQRGEDGGSLLDDIGGKERIHELATLVPATSNAWHYARIVVEKSVLRRHLQAGQLAIRNAHEGRDPEQTRQELLELLDHGSRAAHLPVETWHQFESQAHDVIPVLVDRLWPEAAFGFIAAPPKKGKTWVALALAVSVATGKPFLGHYTVPKPRPVLYVALEGHRAALRARVGAIARGLGADPDTDGLDNLHWLYKPPGINLADPAWAQRLKRAADQIDAALVIVDVLRAGARIKENDQTDFSNLRANLQPLNDAGRSIAMCHHNVKLSEISKERDPGERMSGTGAMYGALDAAIYITGSQDHARRLRLDFDLRDLATPDTINVELQGAGSGDNGGFTYRDTATLTIVENEVDETDVKAPAADIRDYVLNHGGDVQTIDVRGHFEISADTLTRRLGRLRDLGVHYVKSGGRHPARLVITTLPPSDPQQTIHLPATSAPPQPPHAESSPRADVGSHNHAVSQPPHRNLRNEPVRTQETADLQHKPDSATSASPTEKPPPAEASGITATSRTAATTWINTGNHHHLTDNDLTTELLNRWPTLNAHDLTALLTHAEDLRWLEPNTNDTPPPGGGPTIANDQAAT